MTNERLCLHEEVERNYFKTECGAYYPHHDYVEGEYMMRPGKKKAGRSLDGRTWDELPAAA